MKGTMSTIMIIATSAPGSAFCATARNAFKKDMQASCHTPLTRMRRLTQPCGERRAVAKLVPHTVVIIDAQKRNRARWAGSETRLTFRYLSTTPATAPPLGQ